MAQLSYNSAFNSEKNPTNINEFFNYFVQNEKPENAVLILPTTKYVNWAKEKFIRKYFNEKKMPTPELKFYNLKNFAKLCLEKLTVKESYEVLSDAGIFTFMETAANNPDLNLQYFKAKNQKISLTILQKIKDIILGLKEDGITPESMLQDLAVQQNIASAELRFSDLTKIYSEYEKLLNEKIGGKIYLDEPAIFQRIFDLLNFSNEKNSNQKNSNFPFDAMFGDNTVIMFHGFSEFKLPEAQFVAQFAKSKIPTVVHIDYSQIEGPNIDSLPQNVRRLAVADLNQKSANLKNFSHSKNNLKPSQFIKKWLFNETKSLYSKEILEQIKIFEMPDRVEEVKHLANLVRFLNEEKNIPFSEMCICSRNPKLYADLFREFFSESGLVINISDRFSLSNSSPIILIFSLLEIVAKNWQRNDIEKIISSQIIREIIPEISTLITVAKKYRIVGGSKNYNTEKWKTLLTKHKMFFEKTLKTLENTDSSDDNKNIKNSINEIETSLKIFEKLEKLLDFKNKNYTFSEFSKIIKEQIISKIKIAENIFSQYEKLYFSNDFLNEKYSKKISKNLSLEKFQILEEIEKNGKSLSKFIEVLDELEKIENDKNENFEYSFSELIDKLKTAISGERYNLNEKKSLGINITSIEQSRGIPYSVIILCGAIDSEFPLNFKTDTFLGKELKHSEELHNDNERILFYQFLTNNIEFLDEQKMQIFISYPAKLEKKSTVRSRFIDDLFQITSKDSVAENIFKIGEIKEKNDEVFIGKNELQWLNYLTQKTDFYNFLIDNCDSLVDENKNKFLNILKNFREKNDFQKEIKSGIKQDKLTISTQKFQSKLNSKIYSISQLENFANCPFSFFVQNILNLKAEEKFADDELSALDFGNYLHKILESFYEQNLNISDDFISEFRSFDLKNIDENQKNKYLEQLKNIGNNLIGELDFSFFRFEKEKIIGKNGILENWFFNEIKKLKNWGFSSILFEYKFGYEKESFVILSDENADEIRFRGKIDRIEICEKEGEIQFIISDYKRSKISIKKEILAGKSLQIPIYLLAIKQLFSAKNFIPFGGLHYVLTDGKNQKILLTNSIIDKEKFDNFDEILENSLKKSLEYKNKINSLFFEPDKSSNCRYCDYSSFCRVEK